MNNILEIKDLNKSFENFTLDNITFNVERGSVMGFIGPNGAGKSTIIKLIMNLIKKESGYINIFGLDNLKNDKDIKQKIGFVYDENYFYEELNMIEMKNILRPFYKNWNDTMFERYIKEFELPKKSKIKTLSKGMKMKLSIAFALSHGAELIIMDEPTAGLDPVFRRELLEILFNIIQDENVSLFFSTHITDDLEKIADYITFINKGKLVFSKAKDEIIESYGLVKGEKELLDNDTRREFVSIKETNFGFEALTKDIVKARKLFKGRSIIERASLEDIMVYTVRGNV